MAKEIDLKSVTLEDELRLFEAFINSPAWAIMKTRWQPLVASAIGGALSGKATDRSFLAGKANGLKYFLEYPDRHIRELRSKLKGIPTPPRKEDFEEIA